MRSLYFSGDGRFSVAKEATGTSAMDMVVGERCYDGVYRTSISSEFAILSIDVEVLLCTLEMRSTLGDWQMLRWTRKESKLPVIPKPSRLLLYSRSDAVDTGIGAFKHILRHLNWPVKDSERLRTRVDARWGRLGN